MQVNVLKIYRNAYEKPNGRHNIGKGPEIKLETVKSDRHKCDFNAKYRVPNGSCNNKQFPFLWGVAYTPFRRYGNFLYFFFFQLEYSILFDAIIFFIFYFV